MDKSHWIWGISPVTQGGVMSMQLRKPGYLSPLLLLLSNFLLLAVLLCPLGIAQENVKRYFDLNELGDVPGVVQVSTDYLTIIEFEGNAVEEASTARSDLYILEISDNVIKIRANKEVVNTDLYARIAGKTVLFKLESDPTTNSPRRYVVRNTPPPERGVQRYNGTSGAVRPNQPTETGETPLFPLGLLFEADLFQPRQNEIIIQYRLINESDNPVINDPFRLRVYYGDTSIRYNRTSSPVAGRPNFLAPGEAEYGQIIVPQAPASLADLELEWVLIEVGPGTPHRLIRNFADIARFGSSVTATVQPVSPAIEQAQEASTDITRAETATTVETTLEVANQSEPVTTETSEAANTETNAASQRAAIQSNPLLVYESRF